jgi:hypothetical protein
VECLLVIARKVSQCAKNALGANTVAAFISVILTLMKVGGGSVMDTMFQILYRICPQHVSTNSIALPLISSVLAFVLVI